jgi:hypothetical protein
MKLRSLYLPTIILLLLIGTFAVINTKSQISSIESSWAKSIPVIDGSFTEDEWADATYLSFYHTTPSPGHDPDFIHIFIKNTDGKLFLLFDDLPDNTSDVEDHLWVFFDANWDAVIDDNLTMFLDRDHDPMKALPGNDFAEWAIGFGPSPYKAIPHTIIEIAISITFTASYDGSSNAAELNNTLPVGTENNTIRVMFSAAALVCGWNIPQDGSPGLPETYSTLTLSSKSPLGPIVLAFIIIGAILLLGIIIVVSIFILKRR